MTHRLATLLLCLAGSVLAFQPGVTLRGRVTDFKTGEPIAKALVSIHGQDRRALTDEIGRFEIPNVSPGEVELYVSTIDYGLLKQRIQVEPGQPELELLLGQEALKHTEHITVASGPFAPALVEAPVEQSLTGTELKNLSSVLLDDPIRAVQSEPGVSANNEWYAQFSVRGAGPAQIGLFIDGALMTEPFHAILDDRNGSCSISLLENSEVASTTLLSGNFPAQYGDFTGAVLDIQTRQGDAERTSFRADISTVAASVSLEGPLGTSKKVTWLASARKDYVSLLMGRGSGLGLSFYDFFGDLTYSPTDHHRVSFTALHGQTSISKDTNSTLGINGLHDGDSRSELATLRWTWSNASTVSQAAAYLSADSETTHDASADVRARSTGRELGFREDLTAQLASWNRFQAGADYRQIQRDFLTNESWNYATEQPSQTLIQTARFSQTLAQPGAYLQDTLSLPRLTVVLGGRWDRFGPTRQNTFLPRVSATLSLWRRAHLTAAAGQYSRFPDPIDLYGEFATPTLLAERATHLSLAFEQALSDRTRLRVEAYDRLLRDGVFSAASQFRSAGPQGPILYPHLGPVLANSLRGYSRGLEFTLQRRSANRLTGWISYALGYARSIDTATGVHFWSDFDQRHNVSIFGSYRITESINLSADAKYGSGFPIVGYLGAPLQQGRWYFPLIDTPNTQRMPAYFRLDARVNKAFHRKRSKTTLYAELRNITNHTNYYYWGFVTDYARYGYIMTGRGTFLGIIPSAGLSIEF